MNAGSAFEFEVAGLDLRDYQQDFLVNEKVGLTSFTPDQPLNAVLDPTPSETIRVAASMNFASIMRLSNNPPEVNLQEVKLFRKHPSFSRVEPTPREEAARATEVAPTSY